MGGKKKLWLTITVVIVALLAVGALMVLPLYIALAVGGVAVLVVLFVSGSPSRRRWDAASKAEAEAARRGNQAVFMDVFCRVFCSGAELSKTLAEN